MRRAAFLRYHYPAINVDELTEDQFAELWAEFKFVREQEDSKNPFT